MTEQEKCLAEFIRTFKGSLDPRLWIELVKEEFKELQAEEYGTEAHLKEFADLLYVNTGLELVASDYTLDLMDEEEKETLGELGESIDVFCVDFNYPNKVVKEAFKRVHESNMSKLGEDGKPILREDGKVLKGPNYKAPDLSDLIEQMETKQ